jgi:hypothetical protein
VYGGISYVLPSLTFENEGLFQPASGRDARSHPSHCSITQGHAFFQQYVVSSAWSISYINSGPLGPTWNNSGWISTASELSTEWAERPLLGMGHSLASASAQSCILHPSTGGVDPQ